VALATALAAMRSARAEELPMMDATQAVICFTDAAGKRWRLQCDDGARRCLYAPDHQLTGTDDSRGPPLEQERECVESHSVDLDKLRKDGYQIVRGRVDAPFGWMRDERGRVFQVNFDLKRRLYIGAGYAPGTGPVGGGGRTELDFGLLSLEGNIGSTRHRLHLLEGNVKLQPFSGEFVLVHYDLSHEFEDPLLRLTTFFGKPRRYDLGLNLGGWFEAGAVEMRNSSLGDQQLWRIITSQATLDLWRSDDLSSFVRVRGGVGVERGVVSGKNDRTALTPGGAIEGDLTLDDGGFHHLIALASFDQSYFLERHELLGLTANRFKAALSYEVIVLAINDQPLSLVLGAEAERRDDLPGVTKEWNVAAKAGLRFSLWAPPRSPR
jgi:hypothetical protein